MRIATGTHIGPYEIVGWLGAGGMGEVYRARDPRLARDVAIKLIRDTFATDTDRLHRFEQEARAAGQLSHPNILAVHDVGRYDGAPYIVSELLEGESLRSRLQSGPLSSRKAIDYARQIAEGLAAAHDKGIVHRDVKPENLFLTHDGRVKILDFGIAKLTRPPDDAAVTSLPTDTAPGGVVGTVRYMSPEQVRGEAVDARSDLFSFGAVLFEMLAGRAPFTRDTAAETMTAILREEPAALPAGASPALERIVARCLEKTRDARFQSARDLAFGLEYLSGTSGAAPAGRLDASQMSRRSRAWPWVAAGALALGLGATAWTLRQQVPPSLPVTPAASPSASGIRIEKLTNRGNAGGPAISTDGRYIAYSAPDDTGLAIWLRDIANKAETRLVSGLTTDVGVPIRFGERGHALYYEVWSTGRDGWTLYTIPLVGGQPRSIPGSLDGLSPGERHMAFPRTVGAKRVLSIGEVDTGVEREVGDVTGGGPLTWSRDGSTLLFTRRVSDGHALFTVNADATNERQVQVVSQRPQRALWSASGTAIVYSVSSAANEVQLVGLDVATGKSQPVGDRTWRGINLLGWLPDGRHFVATESSRPGVTVWLVSHPDGKATRILADTRTYFGVRMTGDGTRLAAVDFGVRSDVLVSPAPAAGPFKRIASGTDVSHSLCWTPDGRIIFSSNEAGSYDLYVMNADGSGRRQLTFDRSSNEIEPAATPDGRSVIFVSDHSGERGLSRVDLDGTGLKRLTSPAPDHGDREPQVTADNKWIIYRKLGQRPKPVEDADRWWSAGAGQGKGDQHEGGVRRGGIRRIGLTRWTNAGLLSLLEGSERSEVHIDGHRHQLG